MHIVGAQKGTETDQNHQKHNAAAVDDEMIGQEMSFSGRSVENYDDIEDHMLAQNIDIDNDE